MEHPAWIMPRPERRNFMKKSTIKIGMLVTCKERVEAYGSGSLQGHPSCFFEPGDIGIVARIDVPYVVGREGTFACVDFYKPGNIQNAHHWQEYGETPWRAGLDYRNIRELTTKELKDHFYHSLTVEVCVPNAENKALIQATFPYQCADTVAGEACPERVVIRLLHPISLWQIYWLGIQQCKGKIRQWYTLENEMPCS
jgi:hypothetical protein